MKFVTGSKLNRSLFHNAQNKPRTTLRKLILVKI